jgi:hypothetical protein
MDKYVVIEKYFQWQFSLNVFVSLSKIELKKCIDFLGQTDLLESLAYLLNWTYLKLDTSLKDVYLSTCHN